MGFLEGKRALIVGVLSKHSIAYGIADAMHREGASIALTYQSERFKERINEFAQKWDSHLLFECDVTNDDQIQQVFTDLSQSWPDGIDCIIHSVGFAPAHELEGSYVDVTTREGFKVAHDISSYSFVALAKAGQTLLKMRQGSLLTLTYIGAQRAMPNYNVMGLAKASLEANVRYMAQSLGNEGIRVNAISAGPIKTLAASGIKSFRKMLTANANASPLKRNVTIEEVGNAAAFLCSNLATGITGEILYVDAGFHSTAGFVD